MAEAIYLVTKSESNKNPTINGIRAVVINADDAAAASVVIAAAVTQANKATYTAGTANANQMPPIGQSGYFDTVLNITDLTAGPLKDANDAFVFGLNGAVKVEG